MKKITGITPEQQSSIPAFVQKWMDAAEQPIDRESAKRRLNAIMPERTVIFAESITNASALIVLLLEGLQAEYDSQLHSQLHSQLDSQFYSQLHSQLGSQLDSQLRSQLYSQLDSQLYSQLHSQIRSQLYSHLYSQLYSHLGSQLDSQLHSQLGSQLDSQLRSQLYSQLDSQLYSQLGSQLDSQLRSQLYSHLGSQLDSQLHSQLGSQLDSHLDSQLDSQLHSQPVKWSYYVSFFWYSWAGYYDFAESIGVKFDAGAMAEFRELLLNAPLCVFVGNLIFVVEKPAARWDAEKRLGSDQKMAIEWADGTGFYYLDGVALGDDLWRSITSKRMNFGEMMRIENADHRALALKYNPEAILASGAELIDRSERGNELYLIERSELNRFLDEPEIYFLKMTCPTGRVFVEGVDPGIGRKYGKADHCQAYALGLTPTQYGFLRNEG